MSFIITSYVIRHVFRYWDFKSHCLFLAVPDNGLDELLNTFNSYNSHIQFTIATETDKSVPFLDTLLSFLGLMITKY